MSVAPLALLHGFTGMPDAWAPVIEELGLRACFAPALMGHGPEPAMSSSYVEEVDRLARQIADAFNGIPGHLCGYSLGGRVALGLLVRHPSLFGRATLIGAHAGLEHPAARTERERSDEAWARLLEERGLDAFFEEWSRQAIFASQASLDAATQERQRAYRTRHSASGLASAMRVLSLARMPAFWNDLGGMRMRVDVVVGALDEKFKPIAARMAASLPQARVVVVPGVGHNVLLESPSSIANILTDGP